MNPCAHFGIYLRNERKRRGVLLWKFAASIPFPQSNVQRMESGNAEPRIGLAVRMVHALGANVGEFMTAFMLEQRWGSSPVELSLEASSDALQPPPPNFAGNMSGSSSSPAVIFGLLLKQARLANNLNQAQIAEAASYTVRSLISVEKGRQEPMITNALRLVWSTGCDPVNFFNVFSELYLTAADTSQ